MWDVQYEADVLPQNATPAWTEQTGGTPTGEISPAGILHILIPDGTTDHLQYFINNIGTTNAVGSTYEIKLKMTNALQDFDFGIWLGDDVQFFGLDFWNDRIVLEEEFMQDGLDHAYMMDTTDDYHVYRATISGSTVSIYVDGVLRLSEEMNGLPEASTGFGHFGGSSANIEANIDYVYYRTDGAFAPESGVVGPFPTYRPS